MLRAARGKLASGSSLWHVSSMQGIPGLRGAGSTPAGNSQKMAALGGSLQCAGGTQEISQPQGCQKQPGWKPAGGGSLQHTGGMQGMSQGCRRQLLSVALFHVWAACRESRALVPSGWDGREWLTNVSISRLCGWPGEAPRRMKAQAAASSSAFASLVVEFLSGTLETWV